MVYTAVVVVVNTAYLRLMCMHEHRLLFCVLPTLKTRIDVQPSLHFTGIIRVLVAIKSVRIRGGGGYIPPGVYAPMNAPTAIAACIELTGFIVVVYSCID